MSPCPAAIAFTWSLSFPFGFLAKFSTKLDAQLVASSTPLFATIDDKSA